MATTMSRAAAPDNLKNFAARLESSYSSGIPAAAEEQLKGPVGELLSGVGKGAGRRVLPRFESSVKGVGRPDAALDVDGLLCGYLELKAPDTPLTNLKGRDREQLERFRGLPNVLYTNGSEWVLYQLGERKRVLRFSGDVIQDGAKAVTNRDAEDLDSLVREFLGWTPIVPSTAKELAEALAPLCHLVRKDVTEALGRADSAISSLAHEWREYLFPEADDERFADAYAQTLTYALLLARMEGEASLSTDAAIRKLRGGHDLLAQVLALLADQQAREELATGVELLERTISAVDPEQLERNGEDPWVYFYEDFLAAYDRRLRSESGVYYTPTEVVEVQTTLVEEILRDKLGFADAFADERVSTLDMSAGTCAYPLSILEHALETTERRYGAGMRAAAATGVARRTHAFESMVGPYAVGHLKLSQKVMEEGGSLPEDGLRVYLTDTLESPHSIPSQPPLVARKLGEEHKRALEVKKNVRPTVCMGNPPYNQQRDGKGAEPEGRRGGWVRFGEGERSSVRSSRRSTGGGILEDFLEPLRRNGNGVHAKSLYNDYVYFWRWALWKTLEQDENSPGVISLITSAAFLRGPGFEGMREHMRRSFDEMWIIDLEGGRQGSRKSENIFTIQTAVAITIGVRYGDGDPDASARVHYTRVEGTTEEKLARLDKVEGFDSLEWQECLDGYGDPLFPEGETPFFGWPALTDVIPWQHSGCQLGRNWLAGENDEVLERRWRALLNAPDRAEAFCERPKRKVGSSYRDLDNPGKRLPPIAGLPPDAPCPETTDYVFRAFDRQRILKDGRLGTAMRPELWRIDGPEQLFFTGSLTRAADRGPVMTAAAAMPDAVHTLNGGKCVMPLYRDRGGRVPNVTAGIPEKLGSCYGREVNAEEVVCYTYAMLGQKGYTEKFYDDMYLPGPRLPLTKRADLFERAVDMGRKLIGVHTYGTRLSPAASDGEARLTRPISTAAEEYPRRFSYDAETLTLHVGDGEVHPVRPEVWDYEIGGLYPLSSWLGYRMLKPKGKWASPLDDIRPHYWTPQMSRELLELVWLLEETLDLEEDLTPLLDEVADGPCFVIREMPDPGEDERRSATEEEGTSRSQPSIW